MNNLVYKELRLSIGKFFFVLPFLLSLLLLIPMWIFTIVFSYFFWISVTTIHSTYLAQQDMSFCSMLPVSKKEIISARVYSFFILEGVHLVSGLIMGIVHVALYGGENFLLDLNFAFIGIILVMYGIFNIVFLPLFYKTAYKYGMPVIYGIAAALVYAFIFEFGSIRFEIFRTLFEGTIGSQLIVLAIGVVISLGLSYIALKKSIGNFERIS